MAEAEGEEGAPAVAAPPEPEKPTASAELLEACMLGRAAKLNVYFAKRPEEKEILNELKSKKNGWSPLQVACGYAKSEGVQALLELGNSVDLVDNMGMTALHTAADCPEIDVLPLLLAHESSKAALNVQDNDGCTALMYAAWSNRKENVIALLRAGADTSLANGEGKTALAIATEMKNKESIEYITNGPPPEETAADAGGEKAE